MYACDSMIGIARLTPSVYIVGCEFYRSMPVDLRDLTLAILMLALTGGGVET